MNIVEVNDEYEKKMLSFEIDCNDLKGDASACHHVGEYYAIVKDNHDKAFKLYNNNCQNNNYYPSCFNLAKLYLAGKGTEQSYENAKEYFSKACNGEHLPACYHFGVMDYLSIQEKIKSLNESEITGSDLIKKLNQSTKLLETSCLKGNADSCYFAGGHYINKGNISNDRNPSLAMEYFMKSCDMNHAPSCYNLAVLYKHGDNNIKPNEKKFLEYKTKTQDLIAKYGNVTGTRIA